MNKIDLSFKLNNLDGSEGKFTAGQILGNALGQSTDNKMKFYDWAVKCHKEGVLLVDDADKKLLRDWIDQSQTIAAIAAGPILKAIDSSEKD